MNWITGVAAITGLIGLGILKGNLDTTKQMAQLAGIQAEAARNQAVAAGKAADAAQKSIEVTVENFRLDQRAWVGIPNFRLITLEPNKSCVVEIQLVNTGKTVTRGGKHIGYIFLPVQEMTDFNVDYRKNSKDIKRLPPLFPNAIFFEQFITGRPVTTTEVEEVKLGHRFIYVWGDVIYSDVFSKKPHLTQFCGKYIPRANRFETCNHDYAD